MGFGRQRDGGGGYATKRKMKEGVESPGACVND